MAIERLRKEIVRLRREVELIRHILEEDYDLDEKTRRALEEARKMPESEYVDIDEVWGRLHSRFVLSRPPIHSIHHRRC